MLITRPHFASTDLGVFYFIMNIISPICVSATDNRIEGKRELFFVSNVNPLNVTISVMNDNHVVTILTITKKELNEMCKFINEQE